MMKKITPCIEVIKEALEVALRYPPFLEEIEKAGIQEEDVREALTQLKTFAKTKKISQTTFRIFLILYRMWEEISKWLR